MKLFRNWFKKKTFYYEDLPPEERIYLTIKDYVFPRLEAQGFSLTRKPLRMTRNRGLFIQSIEFQKNKWNRRGEMTSFCPYLLVSISSYTKWHLKTYGIKQEENDELVTAREVRFLPGRRVLLERL